MTERRAEVRHTVGGRVKILQGDAAASLPLKDVSASCAFCPFELPESINPAAKATAILQNTNEHVISDCVLVPMFDDEAHPGRPGVLIKRADGFRPFLDDVRKNGRPKPKPESLVNYHRFLISKLLASIETIESREERKNKTLIGICTTLALIGIAPYLAEITFPQTANGFFGVFGLWGAGYAFYYVYQYLKIRGIALKEKARYYRQICLSRGFLLEAEPDQWQCTVLPIGIGFPNYPRGSRQRWPGDWSGPRYLSIFVAYIAVGIGLVAMWFVAHVLRSLAANVPLDGSILLTGMLLLAPAVPVAIHIFGRACFYYHRAIEEAKRIRPADPNPDLPLQKRFEGTPKWLLISFFVLLYGSIATVGVGCAASIIDTNALSGSQFVAFCIGHKTIAVLSLVGAFAVHVYLKSRDVVRRIQNGVEQWHRA